MMLLIFGVRYSSSFLFFILLIDVSNISVVFHYTNIGQSCKLNLTHIPRNGHSELCSA
jgi:hypothetical protein